MADPIRKDRVVRFTRMVQDTLVHGLRLVFNGTHPEKQLRGHHGTGLRIVTEYPLTRQEYPTVLVEFQDRQNRAAGIGHQERFLDPNGIMRIWDHRRFNGSITFHCLGLTPVDRDVIYDALVETIAFGHLPHMSLQANLFSHLYGSPDDPADPFRALSQLFLNTDIMENGGISVTPAPWGAEDDLVYRKSLVIECIGGFYNAVPTVVVPGVTPVTHVFTYPHLREVLSLPLWENDEESFTTPDGENFDAFSVEGVADISGSESPAP